MFRLAVLLVAWIALALALSLIIDRTFMFSDSRWYSRIHGALFGGGTVLLVTIIMRLIQHGRLRWLTRR
jgi:hypothetical protein